MGKKIIIIVVVCFLGALALGLGLGLGLKKKKKKEQLGQCTLSSDLFGISRENCPHDTKEECICAGCDWQSTVPPVGSTQQPGTCMSSRYTPVVDRVPCGPTGDITKPYKTAVECEKNGCYWNPTTPYKCDIKPAD